MQNRRMVFGDTVGAEGNRISTNRRHARARRARKILCRGALGGADLAPTSAAIGPRACRSPVRCAVDRRSRGDKWLVLHRVAEATGVHRVEKFGGLLKLSIAHRIRVRTRSNPPAVNCGDRLPMFRQQWIKSG
jgi:hypothetical protein